MDIGDWMVFHFLHRYLVSDGRGLSLDILPSGKMSWLYRYCLNGKYGKVSLGHYPDLPLRTARERRDELAGKVAKGESPAMEKKLARAGMATNPTVKEFGERYYKEQVMRRWKDPKTIRRYLDNESVLTQQILSRTPGAPPTGPAICNSAVLVVTLFLFFQSTSRHGWKPSPAGRCCWRAWDGPPSTQGKRRST